MKTLLIILALTQSSNQSDLCDQHISDLKNAGVVIKIKKCVVE